MYSVFHSTCTSYSSLVLRRGILYIADWIHDFYIYTNSIPKGNHNSDKSTKVDIKKMVNIIQDQENQSKTKTITK